MPQLLTGVQIAGYNDLRGYAVADPCDTVPGGDNRKCGSATRIAGTEPGEEAEGGIA